MLNNLQVCKFAKLYHVDSDIVWACGMECLLQWINNRRAAEIAKKVAYESCKDFCYNSSRILRCTPFTKHVSIRDFFTVFNTSSQITYLFTQLLRRYGQGTLYGDCWHLIKHRARCSAHEGLKYELRYSIRVARGFCVWVFYLDHRINPNGILM